MSVHRIITAVILFSILALSAFLAIDGWLTLEGVEISFWGSVALIAGIILSLLIGCGLMALAFYSSRSGHDDDVRDINKSNLSD